MVAPKLMFLMTTIMYVQMDEVNIYLTYLINEGKLSHKEAEIFVDFAQDLVLDGYSDLEIENIIIRDINQTLERK